MNTNKKITAMEDMKVKFSILWVFVMFNMLSADILSFMYPGSLKEIMTGYAGGIQITPEFLLVAAILLEIPIAMIFLSRVLKYRANRWANIIAGVVTIAYVIGGGATYLHYIFFATIEVVCMLLIVWYAWTWRNPEGQS
ncbi:MAG: hypothetical protein HY741_25770 [Chloroflexi bacterium]|nr:hypothetical protein [Chloroflexota bacterium]